MKSIPLSLLFFLLICSNWGFSQVNPEFDGSRAFSHIEKQVLFGPRSITHPSSKNLTHDYIVNNLKRYTDKVTSQEFTAYGLIGRNIWATFPGEKSPNIRIMIGAHWDTRPQSELDENKANLKTPTSGANDGGSGVAVLLELARALTFDRSPTTVDLVFFDLEDLGNIDDLPFAIGASEFVKKNSFYRPNKGVIVDMVCDENLLIPKELYSKRHSRQLLEEIWSIGEELNVNIFSDKDGTFIQDDHLPFIRSGLNVVNLIHYPFPDYWHTTRDTIDKCDKESLSQIGNVILTLIYKQDKT